MEMTTENTSWTTVEKIAAVVRPFCQAEGFELVDVTCTTRNREKIIRLSMDKSGGITLADCVYISRQLGDLMDVQLEDLGSYRLEVSSPGPKRPLNTKADFKRFTGHKIKIFTHEPVEGRKKFTGILEKTTDDSVIIAVDDKRIEIADLGISKAMLAGQ